MIDIDRLKQFVLHPDQRIRREVMRYFHTTRLQDPDILGLALDFCQKYGIEDNLFAIYQCTHLPIDNKNAQQLWQMMKDHDNPLFKAHASRLICNAPLDFLERHIKILKKQGLQKQIKAATARIKFKNASAKQIWDELNHYSESHFNKHIDDGYVNALTDMLTSTDYPSNDEILDLLEDEDIQGMWFEVFLINLTAKRKIEQAVPIINEKMHIDDDSLAPACLKALGDIGTESVLDMIVSDFEYQPWHYQVYACGVFERIRHDKTEDAIISLLEKKEHISDDIFYHLCFALCDIFSEKAFDWGRTIIDDLEALTYDNMKERLITLSTILEQQLPERELWESQLENDWQRLVEYRNKQPKGFHSDLNHIFRQIELEDDYGIDSEESFDPFCTKVGRNKPCPCGSGKKYKKCCGRISPPTF